MDTHLRLAWANLLFLAFFVFFSYNAALPTAAVLTSELESVNTLTDAEKLSILSGLADAAAAGGAAAGTSGNVSGDGGVQAVAHGGGGGAGGLFLHLTRNSVELAPLLILLGLLFSVYSLFSSSWAGGSDGSYHCEDVRFQAGGFSEDTAVVLLDGTFWAVFVVTHAFVYLYLLRICVLEGLGLYIVGVGGASWGLMNRVLQACTPAVVAAGMLLFALHVSTLERAMSRDMDFWLPYVVLVGIDALAVFGHTYDASLVLETALNCRIVYVTASGVLVVGMLLFVP